MSCKSILESSDETQLIDYKCFWGGMGVGEGKLNDWFFDDHYMVKVML